MSQMRRGECSSMVSSMHLKIFFKAELIDLDSEEKDDDIMNGEEGKEQTEKAL